VRVLAKDYARAAPAHRLQFWLGELQLLNHGSLGGCQDVHASASFCTNPLNLRSGQERQPWKAAARPITGPCLVATHALPGSTVVTRTRIYHGREYFLMTGLYGEI
jgi:hypothetical protein